MPPLHCWDIAAVSLAHPLLCSSLLVFCVPPFPPYLPPSVKHTALPICSLSLSPARRALPCFLVLFIPSDGEFAARRYTWEAHLGYSCAAAIAASCVGRWVSVCVFCMHVFVLCIRVCVCGGIHLSGAAIQGRSSHLGLQMSLPLHIVLKLLSAASLCVLALPPFSSSRSVLVSFAGSLLRDHFSPPLFWENWERSYILGSWRLYVYLFGEYGSSPSVYPAGLFCPCVCTCACVGDRGNLCFAIC